MRFTSVRGLQLHILAILSSAWTAASGALKSTEPDELSEMIELRLLLPTRLDTDLLHQIESDFTMLRKARPTRWACGREFHCETRAMLYALSCEGGESGDNCAKARSACGARTQAARQVEAACAGCAGGWP